VSLRSCTSRSAIQPGRPVVFGAVPRALLAILAVEICRPRHRSVRATQDVFFGLRESVSTMVTFELSAAMIELWRG